MTEEALPFVLGAVLALIGAVSAGFVEKRAKESANSKVISPNAARIYSVWAADAAQGLLVMFAPGVAGVALVKASSLELCAGYVVVVLVGLTMFRKVLYADPATYARRKRAGITLVPAVGVIVNAVAAIVVQIAAS